MNKAELIEEFVYSLTPEDQEEWFISRENCDKSLYYFIKEMGGCLLDSNGDSIAGGDIVDYLYKPICDFWQDDTIKRKFVYEPRRWLKSTFRKWGQNWTYLQNNEVRILTASEVVTRPKEWLTWQGKQMLTHQRLRWVYPELRVIDESYKHNHTYSSEQILLPRKGIYDAPTFVGIGIHGSSQGGHYDIIEPDDICGERAMESAVLMEDAFRWFDNIDPLLNDPATDIIRGVGTHWAPGDLGIYIQEEFPEYQWIIVPCIKDEELEDTHNIRYLQNPNVGHGESNWEERGSTKYYMDMAANPQTQMKFWTQEQNNPGKAAGILTKILPEWIRLYLIEEREDGDYIICCDEPEDSREREFKLSKIPQHGMLDMGGFKEVKLIKKGSNNVIMIGGQPKGSTKKFVTYYWEGKLKKPSGFGDKWIAAHVQYYPYYWNIEPYGQHEWIRKTLKEYAESKNKKIKLFAIQLKQSDLSEGAKDNRITDLVPVIESGEIYLRGRKLADGKIVVHESMKPLWNALTKYPNWLTKDGPDALGWMRQLHWSIKPKGSADEYNRRQYEQYKQEVSGSRTGYG
jgi:hypothetical protein